jgi:uncharacterized protein YkwD
MRQALGFVAALIAFATVGAATHAGERVPARLLAPIAVDRPDQGLFNEAVLIFSNAARQAHGRPPLRPDPGLSRAAADHARNMARLRTHGHVLPVRGQAKLAQRMHRQSLEFRTAGENIAMDKVYRLLGRPIAMGSQDCRFVYGDTGQPVPIHTYASLAEELVARWLASPKHRASLLSARFRRIGAGVGLDPGGQACGDLYLVQTFAD